MKIYVHDKGVILSGKAWEIREKLKEYGKHYQFVSDWVENNKSKSYFTIFDKPVSILKKKMIFPCPFQKDIYVKMSFYGT